VARGVPCPSKSLTKLAMKKIMLQVGRPRGAATKRIMLTDLEKLGLTDVDVVFVHSSLSRIGYVEGGAATVVETLIEMASINENVLCSLALLLVQ
jgi:hypothetical protein